MKATSTKTAKPKTAKAKPAPARAQSTTMTLEEALRQLESLGDESIRKQNAKWRAGDNQFGVKHGDIRVLAKKLKSNPELAMPLWGTGNIDAQYLAILLMKPNALSANELDRLVRSISFAWVAEWLISPPTVRS